MNMLRKPSFPLPLDDIARVERLEEFQLFGTPPELEYDQITQLAAQLLGFPMCLISIVGREEQWPKSRHGIEVECSPRSTAFCTYTILRDDLLVVPDTLEDERFRHNPSVTGPPYVRFYAGAPLIADDGTHLGALCLLDRVPREIDQEQRALLRRLADIVVARFNARRGERRVQKEMREVARDRDALASEAAARQEAQREIGSVVAAIESLAHRLRLLALNASIEAARAGDAGVGFGVVATEVRSLADLTRSATEQARALLT